MDTSGDNYIKDDKRKIYRCKKYRKGVKENDRKIADYLQKACVLCIDFHTSKEELSVYDRSKLCPEMFFTIE